MNTNYHYYSRKDPLIIFQAIFLHISRIMMITKSFA